MIISMPVPGSSRTSFPRVNSAIAIPATPPTPAPTAAPLPPRLKPPTTAPVPALLASAFVLLWLDDGPEHAKWLPEDEKRWLAERLESEEQVRLTHERHTVAEALKDPRVLSFGALYFFMVVNVYGISFWVGEIVDKIGGLSDVGKGFVTAIPYAIAIVGLVLIPRHSDRTGERKLHTAIPLALGAGAFAVSTVVSPVAAIAALAVGLFFLLGAHPVFWAMPAALLSGTAAAAGIALINSIGNLGGFVGPYLVGLVKDATGSTDGGLVALAVLLGIGAFTATRVAHDPAVERAPRAASGRFRRTETAAEPVQPVR